MPFENTGFVLHLDSAGIITSVLFSNFQQFPVPDWLGVSLFSIIDPETEDATLFLLESVKEFGHAEAWPLQLKIDEDILPFYCNSASFGDTIMLMVYQSSGNIISLDPASQTSQPEITAEPGPAVTSQSENDLLDELSRLNNELVNTKRELIRQNVKLKRLQNPWEEGLTFI
jgi:hypothetical protein